jgi:hypothetical protein
MHLKHIKWIGQVGFIVALPLFFILSLFVYLAGSAQAQGGGISGPRNLVANGNFESGFYQVPELGFEPPHVGNVPVGWNWYKNQAYGKYVIDSNQRFGINCAGDVDDSIAIGETQESAGESFSVFAPIPGYDPGPTFNSLALHMQSTDQQDARLGVYQTINVVPGQDYRFSMSATIQVQAGAQTLEPPGPHGTPVPQAPNHTYELYFDHTGNTDWRAIPHEKWTIVTLPEQKLFFTAEETIKKGEEALAEIENYETMVTAQSDKITIFITAWRKWSNWRTALIPRNPAGHLGSAAVAVAPSPTSTPVAEVQAAAMVEQPAQPDPAPVQPQAEAAPAQTETTSTDTQANPVPEQAEVKPSEAQPDPAPVQPQTETAPVQSQPETAPAEDTTAIIPASGGVLDSTDNTLLFILASLIVILGLLGAGIWNMRR